MKNPIAKTSIILSILLVGCSQPSPTNNSDALISSTLWLQSAPEAKLIQEQAYQFASAKLYRNLEDYAKMIDSTGERYRPAVVLDLDETVLDNSPYQARIIKDGQEFSPETWSAWVQEAKAELIPGAKNFLKSVDFINVKIFYISNRNVENLDATMKNLRAHGLPQVDSNSVLLKTDSSDKTARREAVQENFDIVLLVGDQMGDFAEEIKPSMQEALYRYFVALPNPMYGSFNRLSEEAKKQYDSNLEAYKAMLKDQR